MNIRDLPQGSYKVVDQPTNINQLQPGSYSAYDPLDSFGNMAQPKKPLGERFMEGVSKVVPGKVFGEYVGSKIAPHLTDKPLPQAPTGLQAAADVASGVLTAGSFALPGAASIAGKFAQNIGLGAGMSGTAAVARGDEDVAKQALIGGAIGGVASGIGQGVEYLTKSLPSRIVKSVIPTASQKPGMVEHILNKPVGSVEKLLQESQNASKSYNSQIKAILTHPEIGTRKVGVEEVGKIMNQVLHEHPNSYANVESIIKTAKELNPHVAGILDRFLRGGATIDEINQIRVALDKVNNKAFTKLSVLPFKKELSVSLQNSMRDYVQKSVPETAPLFEKWAKEITLTQGLEKVIKANEKYPLSSLRVRWRDILPGVAGFSVGGPTGAIGAMALERTMESPAVQLGAAKALQAAGKTQPVMSAINQIGRTQIPKAVDAVTSGEAGEVVSSLQDNKALETALAFTPLGAVGGGVKAIKGAKGLFQGSLPTLKGLATRINKEDVSQMDNFMKAAVYDAKNLKSDIIMSKAEIADALEKGKKLAENMNLPFNSTKDLLQKFSKMFDLRRAK